MTKEIVDEKRKNRGKGGKNSGNNGNNNNNTNGGGGQSSNNEPYPTSTNQLVRTPPKAGESHTKVIKDKARKRWGVCKRWNLTHLTTEHRSDQYFK